MTDADSDTPETARPDDSAVAPANPDLVRHSVEAILFSADHPVAVDDLQRVLEVRRRDLEAVLAALTAELRDRGVRIQRNGDEVLMVTAPETALYVERFYGIGGTSKLSQSAIETLAIIAYHQPVTRAQIEAIRGVNADYAVNALQARGLIMEAGRLASAGRPVLWGTTMEFLQYLGLSSLEELPHPEIRHPAQTDMFEALDGRERPAAEEADAGVETEMGSETNEHEPSA